MNCIRCGREIEEPNVFCEECLQEMEKQPVNPGTPIQLPVHGDCSDPKRARFRLAESKWTDKIFRLKYIIVFLIILIVLLAAALALCICMLLNVTPDWINEFILENTSVVSSFGK
jgi:hypothetical protein